MDGKVVTYATAFAYKNDILPGLEATGHFEVSASRNAVMVHRCEIRTDWERETFELAMVLAWRMRNELVACDGRPSWRQPQYGQPNTSLSDAKRSD